ISYFKIHPLSGVSRGRFNEYKIGHRMACEYQHFTDNLPLHLRERIMVCAHPDDIDDFSDKFIQTAMMLRT
ncbi:hypothetical protein Q0S65_26490, partial [Escherichia coli O178:H7]